MRDKKKKTKLEKKIIKDKTNKSKKTTGKIIEKIEIREIGLQEMMLI